MKKMFLSALIVLSASSAFAKNLELVCMMGDIADLGIWVYTSGSHATIKVTEGDMSGAEKIFLNTHTLDRTMQDAISAGRIVAIASKSDLQEVFGGAYLDAGMLDMTYNKNTEKWDVLWASGSVVMTAECTDQLAINSNK